MNLLDTNVLSEFTRPQPAEAVTVWLDRLHPERVWTSAISRAEIALGLALMPAGKRQAALAELVPQMQPYYADRSPKPVFKLKSQPLGAAPAHPKN